MHTAVLVLGILLILSELGAIGFMMLNTIHLVTQPKTAVRLVPERPTVSKRTMMVTVVEDKKATTTVIADPIDSAGKKPAQEKNGMGYFSLVGGE